ncbi:telomerase RNA component interacting RNase-like isoform X1 [Rhodnius prolixus]
MVYRSATNEDGELPSRPHNAFKNDGSFLEMFKKMQEKAATSSTTAPSSSTDQTDEPSTLKSGDDSVQIKKAYLGKRRGGGRVLPTGKVKKPKVESVADEPAPNDAWSVYLAEVKRYKETTCEEDEKTRPLVK